VTLFFERKAQAFVALGNDLNDPIQISVRTASRRDVASPIEAVRASPPFRSVSTFSACNAERATLALFAQTMRVGVGATPA